MLLHFAIEPEFLDVNVHPTKMELRFRDGEGIYTMIRDTIAQTLSHKELIPRVSFSSGKEEKENRADFARKDAESPEPFEQKRMGLYQQTLRQLTSMPEDSFLREGQRRDPAGERRLNPLRSELVSAEREKEKEPQKETQEAPPISEEARGETAAAEQPAADYSAPDHPAPEIPKEAPVQMELFDGRFLDKRAREHHRLIGQLFDTYWLVEYQEQLFIIDQHAAHEKILFERTMESLKKRDFGTQMLNPPLILTLGMGEELLMKKYMNYFNDMGFEIEHFGGREYAVRGVPANLPSIGRTDLFLEMLDGLSEDTQAEKPDLIYEKVASMSCKAAVKGNHAMSFAEADALIDQLLGMENPYACPHGRPTIVSMSKYDLEKKFKRIV